MTHIDQQLLQFKQKIESSIVEGGAKGKDSIIRSSALINLIHDAVKYNLISEGVDPSCIYPPYLQTKEELNLAGFLKQKKQDVCVIPKGVKKVSTPITWGPLAFENKVDSFGFEFTEKTLIINVRSQMSSLVKNSDTLFERTFAEAENLHKRYPNAVLGEVYLIPLYEYDDKLVKTKQVGFKAKQTDVEKYISFFDAINNRRQDGECYTYERCALLVVDFSKNQPYLFRDSAELKDAGIISRDFGIEYATLNFQDFTGDILRIYDDRFGLNYILN